MHSPVDDVQHFDTNGNCELDIDEASTELVTNSTRDNDMIRLVKDGDNLSETATSSRCWNRIAWERRTVLERNFFLVTCGLVVLLILLVVILPIINDFQKSGDPSTLCSCPACVTEADKIMSKTGSSITSDGVSVCTSPACVSASARIMSNMDSTVDPCQDFYQYACGGWIHNNPIPTGHSNWDIFNSMSQEVQVTIKKIFDKPLETFKNGTEKFAHYFYQSCIDDNTREEIGGQHLLELLDQIGGWPANNSPAANWSFQKVLETTHNILKSDGLFKWTVDNYKLESNDSVHAILFKPSKPSIPIETSEDAESTINTVFHLSNLMQAIHKVIKLLNIKPTNLRQLLTDIEAVEVIQYQLLSVSMSKNSSWEFVTIDSFQNAIPFLNWNDYFQSAFSQVNITIDPSSHSVLYPVGFFTDLDKAISKLLSDKENGSRTLHNYLGWQIIKSYMPSLSRRFRDSRSMLKTSECFYEEESWRCCVRKLINVMSFAVGTMYVRQEFDPESKSQVESMVAAVKKAFKHNFDKLSWMDYETRLAVKDKADAMTVKIGFPKFIQNQTRLDDFYNGLELNPKEYFKNIVRLNQFSARKNWMEIHKPFEKTFWIDVNLMKVNAYYDPNLNQLILPVVALRNPLFDVSLPHSLNFGAAGFFLGHELTHGFDDTGMKHDRNGELSEWWNNAMIDRFNQQTKCLIDQYSSYEFKGHKLNGQLTLGENIADNGGLKAAFSAFSMLNVSRNEDRLMLPGLNLTQKQLFFLSFAQAFCSSSTDDYIVNLISDDVHPSDRFRVIGTLSNMVEFSSEFQCPSCSPMNPPVKCQVW